MSLLTDTIRAAQRRAKKLQGNLSPKAIEGAIRRVAPEWYAQRQRARFEGDSFREASEVRSAYEGASRGRRTDGWSTVSGASINSENQSALATLRNRARDLARNTWVGRRAVNVLVHNIIGTGIRPSIRTNEALERIVKRWAKRTDADADGLNNLYGIQALAVRTMIESGEALIVRQRQPFQRGTVPLKLRVLEGDYLDEDHYEELENGNQVVQGVEFNSRGERVAYHLYKNHPGDIYGRYTTLEKRRVPASEVIHLFEVLRPGQVRGITAFAPVIIKIRDWDTYEDAQLMRQKIASCFTAFVRTTGDGLPGDDDSERELGTTVEPGMIEILRPGEQVEFGRPPTTDDYADYAEVTLREIAVGLGVSYVALTDDLKGVSFSAGRMGWLEFQRKIKSDTELLYKPRMLHPIADWALEMLGILGEVNDEDEVTWTPPRREMINPLEETKAAQLQVRNGFASRPEILREMGKDPDDVDGEIERDNDNIDDRDFIFDSDPRTQNFNGTPRTDPEDVTNGA